ncbi:hypothetical protein Tco_0583965 [Tanacetum coccineum]
MPFITSFVTHTAEHEGGGDIDSIFRHNLRTQHPSERFVISSHSSHHSIVNAADAEVASFVMSSVPPPPVMTAVVTTTAIASASSAPVLRAGGELATQVYQSLFADFASIGMAGADIAGPSNPAGTELSADTFYSVLDDPDVCRSVVDQLAPHRLFSQLCGMYYDQLFSEFNVGVARQTCLGAEVKMRFEHNLRERKRLEGRCARQVDLMKDKDAKIEKLKALLSLREAEATEVIRLHNQVSAVEAVEAARVSELNSLKEGNIALEKEKNTLEGQVATLESVAAATNIKLASLNAQTAKLTQELSSLQLSCDELSIKDASLESQRDGLIDRDKQVKELSDYVERLDFKLMALALHLDEEFYPCFLTTIVGRRWIICHDIRLAIMKCRQSSEYAAAFGAVIVLAIDKGIQAGLVACIDHEKAGRGLADVASYDPSVEARYVSVVLAFRDLDFNLLPQLESQKDASIADIMNSLCLDGPSVETPEVSRLQPAYEQLLLPIHQKEDNVVVGETPLSDSLNVVHVHVQRLKEGALSYRLSISDTMGALVDPLSYKNLIVTAANVSSIPPILVTDHDVPDARIQDEAPHSPKIMFEKENLETTPEHHSAS